MSAAQPETLDQARHWDRQMARYARVGLCGRCSSQAAFGHQMGWKQAQPPCGECLALVQTFGGVEKANGWRILPSKGSPRTAPDGTTERTA